MADPKMYRELAPYYDLVYSYKDYRAEAEALHELIRRIGRSWGEQLLDVGCGTGRHLEHLRKCYRCSGLDRSPAMLEVARRRLPGVKFYRGSMENFELEARFDVIVCLFGALGYTRSRQRMDRAIGTMARHLRPGGVLLVAPWISPEKWKGRFVKGVVGERPGVSVVRVSRSTTPRPRLSRIEFEYLIARFQGISHVREVQELGLFTDAEVQRAFRAAGLRSRHLQTWPGSANGLHIGVAPIERDGGRSARKVDAGPWRAPRPAHSGQPEAGGAAARPRSRAQTREPRA